ncbi:MAG: phosphoadenylyl-sulfate reductase [Chloroflexi bacterium]|nr:phosphoadenylyl-sulfate reductase [Chloroflexota bacterium]
MNNDFPTLEELRLWNHAFAQADTHDTLRWCVAVFGDSLAVGTGFGVSGMVLLDMLTRITKEIDVFFLDTGLLFPETYEFRRRVEAHYGIRIRGVSASISLEEQARRLGDRLWERNPDLCCAIRKVASLPLALEGKQAWMTAIRRDQSPTRRNTPLFSFDERLHVIKIAPLVRWTEQDCWRYVREHHTPTNPLHDRGYPSFGCWTCTRAVRPGEDLRAGRWSGAAKTECGLHVVDGKLTRLAAPATSQIDGP